MALLYIKQDTTVGELKQFLSDIPDETKIFCNNKDGQIRLDDFKADCYGDSDTHELYIEIM